ncbi:MULTISPECIES: flagellar hook-length control protein FliK [unclassified Pantoea]|uniref:flagellar hook-length control protein FliK n=1 Tax=unclassified Pantoea TaxID=2630326 RepID=UPI001232762B|nr:MULTISPECIES: flagellar hook-length control protein FliK [unclassified Pantoea]KAA5970356.1 flagellar hook-length control protein FliK [Pantoea sp. M_6]KAA5976466.1 flagellar hook-length control protein FliK [Pantoea sp. M_8]KAA5987752.1 flagellar hook-length control protein FliK [Pantoea sp. M_10]
MITLPNIAMKATAKTDAEPSVATDAAAGSDALPQDFLTALGNQLLGLAKQQGKAAQSADAKAEMVDERRPASPLSALLATRDNPANLTALLKPENIKAGSKSADDKESLDAASLSASELQNVQALFAMLPGAATATASAPPPISSESGEMISQSDGGRKALTALTQMLNTTPESSSSQSTAPAKDEKHEIKGAALNAPAASNAASQSSSTAQSSNSSLNLASDSHFQQALSAMMKQDDQAPAHSSASDSGLNISGPITSASTLPAPVTASATSSTPSTPMLNAQLGSDEWQQALSQQIVMFSRNGQQNAELRLHPEDLGAIQISLKLDNDQAQISLVSSHSHVRSALEAAIPQLRSALAESGINLGESQVSSDSSAQSQSFQNQQEARRDGQHGRFSLPQDSDTDITPIAVPAALQARVSGNSAVDTFA